MAGINAIPWRSKLCSWLTCHGSANLIQYKTTTLKFMTEIDKELEYVLTLCRELYVWIIWISNDLVSWFVFIPTRTEEMNRSACKNKCTFHCYQIKSQQYNFSFVTQCSMIPLKQKMLYQKNWHELVKTCLVSIHLGHTNLKEWGNHLQYMQWRSIGSCSIMFNKCF